MKKRGRKEKSGSLLARAIRHGTRPRMERAARNRDETLVKSKAKMDARLRTGLEFK